MEIINLQIFTGIMRILLCNIVSKDTVDFMVKDAIQSQFVKKDIVLNLIDGRLLFIVNRDNGNSELLEAMAKTYNDALQQMIESGIITMQRGSSKDIFRLKGFENGF